VRQDSWAAATDATRPAESRAPGRSTGERALIARIRRTAGVPSADRGGRGILRLGIGDDCAILRPPAREELVVTTDLFLERVHFRRDWHQPEVAGHRCLARGLSDIAAMGATPVAAFLSFALPPELAGDWVRRFLDGLLRLARLHQVPLAGGDTAQAPGYPASASGSRKRPRQALAPVGDAPVIGPEGHGGPPPSALFTADIVVIGRVPRGKALLRSGAQPGDWIYVTGALGGAAAELALLEQHPGAYASMLRSRRGHPHLFPQPRLSTGLALRGRATAAIDLSDGLSTDLTHLCQESGVAAEIEASLIPIHPLASRHTPGAALDWALHGGEDYELLFTARGRQMPAQLGGTPIHRIGTILKPARGRPRITLIDGRGARTAVRDGGWEHLR